MKFSTLIFLTNIFSLNAENNEAPAIPTTNFLRQNSKRKTQNQTQASSDYYYSDYDYSYGRCEESTFNLPEFTPSELLGKLNLINPFQCVYEYATSDWWNNWNHWESVMSNPVEYDKTQPPMYGNLNQWDMQISIRYAQGLSVRLLGISGQPVKYDTRDSADDFKYSEKDMHIYPDHGACFDTEDGGWIYVSNSEPLMPFVPGGVGAFRFTEDGNLVDYDMILEGTQRNCGGGKTPWGTWLTGEEVPWGKIYEVDPTGKRDSNITRFTDGDEGRFFESAICDDRDMTQLECFATVDWRNGEVRRFVPDPNILADAIESGDYSKVLTEGGSLSYLFLHGDIDEVSQGSFSWVTDLRKAQRNARRKFPNCEGIDFFDGILHIVCKTKKQMISLHLDEMKYEVFSTESGSFDMGPDQISHTLGADNETSIVYFVEDGGCSPGVFVANISSSEFAPQPLLQKVPDLIDYNDETVGIALCDKNKRLIVGFQGDTLKQGKLFELTRTDGKPFTELSESGSGRRMRSFKNMHK